MGSIEKSNNFDYDVIIVGAGISGINSAYRVQTELPGYTYTILENRDQLGGTWDLFRYPGIRSDSDLHTFGFSWRPWKYQNPIAEGDLIKKYIGDSAKEFGIDRNIRFRHKVTAANWSTGEQHWSVSVEADGRTRTMTGKFIIWSTGYYNYDEPLKAQIPGLENFQGQTIHPQFWPENLDYTNKKVVVIGSGATAITLIPNLADKAAKVTMLQRSPTYVVGMPNRSDSIVQKYLPTWLTAHINRWRNLVVPWLFFKFCRSYPETAKKMLKKRMASELPSSVPMDPNFSPRYNPWEQRLCVCPDSDFFRCLHSGKTDIVTGNIKAVTTNGITIETGQVLDADIIVTATGLKMQLAGGCKLSVDGKPFDVSSKYMWKSVMLQDLPNSCIVFGYTNASWTLGADCTAMMICRLLKYMRSNQITAAIPRVPTGETMKSLPMMDFNSTYIEKAKGYLPMTGNKGPWTPRSNYFVDFFISRFGNLKEDMEFTKDVEFKKDI